MGIDEIIKQTKVTKSDDDNRTFRVVSDTAKDEDKVGDVLTISEARVYLPEAKVGENVKLPQHWVFDMPVLENGDTYTMGEYGHTKKEATERVVERLKDLI